MPSKRARRSAWTSLATLHLARELRRGMSLPEVLLWVRLRQRGHNRPVWRRQHPIGPFVADFACLEAGLIVEIDGVFTHAGRHERDRSRDAWLVRHGFRVLRLSARSVLDDPSRVADGLRALAMRRARSRS